MLPRIFAAALSVSLALGAVAADWWEAPWTKAHERGPLTADETRAFMRELAQYVFDHHLKRDARSPQRGMVYEYFNTTRAGQFDQWIQGEALDTMHDGAWFAAALVNAHRATGDRFYRDLLTQWVLPFYLKMLNHSDELFSPENSNAAADAPGFDREHALQKGEKGFVPYWWDDGASVSLEMAVKKRAQLNFRGHDDFAAKGEANPQFKLRGYSHGSSNHLAQDLAVMLELAWLLLHDSVDAADRALAAEVAEAAKNLHQCRMNHHGHINGICGAHGLCNGVPAELNHATDGLSAKLWTPDNHYVNCLVNFKPGQRMSTPAFADDQEYLYYAGLARHGTLPRPLAFKLIYDAFTQPQLFRYYCDDWDVPPGLNRFDLHPYYFKDGKPEDYRSDRQGPFKGPRPVGSRMGPQNMIVCGWALQALKAEPGVWLERKNAVAPEDLRIGLDGISRYAKGYEIAIPGNPVTNQIDDGYATFIRMHASANSLLLSIGYSEHMTRLSRVQLFRHEDMIGDALNISISAKGVDFLMPDGKTPDTWWMGTDWDGGRVETGFRIPHRATQRRENWITVQGMISTTKTTNTWFQAYEHGRFSLRADAQRKNFYVASAEANVVEALERELGRGLRTWQAVFKEKGYIPTGFGAASMGGGYQWDDMSDAGGYAHLLSAGAQWLLYLEGKRDWEVQRAPRR